MRIRLVTLIVVGYLASAALAKADSFSITLISSGSGVYDYGITTLSATFDQGETISFTGLSGVTGASTGSDLSSGGWTVESFSSNVVTFVQSVFTTSGFSGTFGDFIIDSKAPPGTVDWSGTASGQLNSGTVSGPVSSAVPEPSSLLLLAAGLSAFGVMRRKLART